jgi:hypothetical protein
MNSTLNELSLKSIIGIGRVYDNFLGPSNNKRETLQKYRYAIVIENSADFVSEKLFDSISGGCIAIYTGPLLKHFGIDDSKLVLGKKEKSAIIKKCIELIELSEIEQYQLAEEQNISLRRISKNWENTTVLRNLARDILSEMK